MLYRLLLSHLDAIKREELTKALDPNNTEGALKYHIERMEALAITMHIISEKEDLNRVKTFRIQGKDAGSNIFDKSVK